MKIGTNYAFPVLSSRFQPVQKRKEQIDNIISFEGSKKSDNAKKYLIYTPMILATIGMGACKDSRSPEDMPQAHWDMIIAHDDNIEQNARETAYTIDADDVSEITDYESMKDTTNYNPVIDKFMKEDKSVVKVKKWESDDADYVNSYRIIGADGYNRNGKKVREIIIHAKEPSISCTTPTYGPQGIEKTYYLPRATKTEYCTNDEAQTVQYYTVEYNEKMSLKGKGGYSKKETVYLEPEDDVAFVVSFKKGDVEYNDGVPFAINNSYHEQVITYDKNGKKLRVANYRPNEYGEIVYDEKTSRDYIKQ